MEITYLTLLLLNLWSGVLPSDIFLYPKILESRENNGSLLLLLHHGFTLDLEKSYVLAEHVQVTIANGTNFDRVLLNGADFEKDLYHNSDHQSSLIVRRLQSGLEIQGILNEELRITPLHHSKRASGGSLLHKVFKVKERSDDLPEPKLPETEEETGEAVSEDSSGSAVDTPDGAPDAFTLELCFITTDEYRAAFDTLADLISYLAIMLNSVRLRYADMERPKINFQLNGVGASNVSEFIVHHGDRLDATRTIYKLAKLIKTSEYDNCDLVFLLTSLSLAKKEGDDYQPANGVAVVEGVCTRNKLGAAKDVPHTYSGARTLAHELGHALGSTHDGSGPYKGISNNQGAETCPSTDGYLMGSGYFGSRKYQLSNCTMEQIRALYSKLSSECVQVRGAQIQTSSIYPGQSMTDTKLCKLLHGEVAGLRAYDQNGQDYKNCKLKCCKPLEGKRYRCTDHAILDGMKCVGEMTCRRGVCGDHQWE